MRKIYLLLVYLSSIAGIFNYEDALANPVRLLLKRTPKNKRNHLSPLLHAMLSLTLSLVLMAGSCKKEQTGLEALPAATQEGKNTFGCLVNGQALVAKGKPFLQQPHYRCNYEYNPIDNKHHLLIYGVDLTQDKLPSITINTGNTILQEKGTYPFQSQEGIDVYAEYRFYSSDVKAIRYKSTNGELLLSKIDLSKQIVSGTFWFNAMTDSGEKIEVREGRFDMTVK